MTSHRNRDDQLFSKLKKLHPQIRLIPDPAIPINDFSRRIFDSTQPYPNSYPVEQRAECWTLIYQEMAVALVEYKVEHWAREELETFPNDIEYSHDGYINFGVQTLWELLVTAVESPKDLQKEIEESFATTTSILVILDNEYMWKGFVAILVNRFKVGPLNDFSDAFSQLLESQNLNEAEVVDWMWNRGPAFHNMDADLWHKVQSAWKPFQTAWHDPLVFFRNYGPSVNDVNSQSLSESWQILHSAMPSPLVATESPTVKPVAPAADTPTAERDVPAKAAEGKVTKKPDVQKAEAEILVEAAITKFVRLNLKISREIISAETGASTGGVSNTDVFKAFKNHQKAQKQSKIRQVQLSTEMLAGIPANIERPEHSAELAELVREQEAEIAAENRGCKPRHKRRHEPS